jgi:hypothetical protein
MRPMKSLSLRTQLILVAAGYAAALAIAAALVVVRYMVYVTHPQDAAAAGGMFAFGDLMLAIFIIGLLLVPTLLLALVVRNTENLSIIYSKLIFGLSLTAPVCAGLLTIPALNQSTNRAILLFGEICLDRLCASPVIFAALVVSRLIARFDRAKRWASYALLVEILTLLVIAATFLLWARSHR